MSLVRRVVKWTLLALGALTATIVALAIAGVGKQHENDGTVVNEASRSPSAPGSRSHPISIGAAAAIGYGWRLRVVSAVPDATRRVVGYRNSFSENPNAAPPPGAQDVLVTLALTYTGGGKDDATSVVDQAVHAMGAHNASYDPSYGGVPSDGCGDNVPPPNFGALQQPVFSGQTVRGNVCFQIARNDARTLLLYTSNGSGVAKLFGRTRFRTVWFALRS